MIYHEDLVMPERCPKSANLRNFIRQSPYSLITPLALPVTTHRLRTRVTHASRGWLASCSLALSWTISGSSLFLTMALRRKRSLSYWATHFLLALSLLIIFWKSNVAVVLMGLAACTLLLQMRIEEVHGLVQHQAKRREQFLISESIA